MKLEVNGIRVEVKGTVRVGYPYPGMGIAFTDLSEENVAQLRRLVANVSRPCVIRAREWRLRCPRLFRSVRSQMITDAAAVQALMDSSKIDRCSCGRIFGGC